MPGILTGAILGTAKVSGETAPDHVYRRRFFYPRRAEITIRTCYGLAVSYYVLATAGTHIEETRGIQYGTALTLNRAGAGDEASGIILRSRQRKKRAW